MAQPVVGDMLHVNTEFVSDCPQKHDIQKGWIGSVRKIDADKDARVHFEQIGYTWIKKDKFDNVTFHEKGIFDGTVDSWNEDAGYGKIKSEYGHRVHVRRAEYLRGLPCAKQEVSYRIEFEQKGMVGVAVHAEDAEEQSGKVVRALQGFGFIAPRGGGDDDVFYHVTNVRGESQLDAGTPVYYYVAPGKTKGSIQAVEVRQKPGWVGGKKGGKGGGKGGKGGKKHRAKDAWRGKGYAPYANKGKKGGQAVVEHTMVEPAEREPPNSIVRQAQARNPVQKDT
eukprot:gene17367-20558_t